MSAATTLLHASHVRSLLCSSALLFCGMTMAQTPVKPAPLTAEQMRAATRPKNFYLMIFGYEMDKPLADSILQKQDMGKNVALLVEKLEGLVRGKKAIHVSSAATPLSSGVRCALTTNAVSIVAEGRQDPATQKLDIKMTRTAKAGGTSAAVSASLDYQGTPFFIGSVPDTSPGKDQLLFMRCVVHYLE